MLTFLIRRILQFIPTVFAVTLILFLLLNVLPGSAAMMAGDARIGVDPLVAEKMRIEMGLDRPLMERYADYMGGLVTGDLGTSFMHKEEVSTMIAERIWPSLKLSIVAMIIALLIGVPLGFISALKQGTWIDPIIMIGAVSGVSMPQFWLGLVLMYVFSVVFELLPTSGYGEGGWQYIILPAFTLGFTYMALLSRTTCSAIIEIKNSDFVRTARAKGLSNIAINLRHIFPNALVLIITTAGLQFGALMGQTVIVEKLFSWPGVGSLLVDSIFLRDLPVAQGCVLLIVVFFLIINLITDVLYAVIDPRIQMS